MAEEPRVGRSCLALPVGGWILLRCLLFLLLEGPPHAVPPDHIQDVIHGWGLPASSVAVHTLREAGNEGLSWYVFSFAPGDVDAARHAVVNHLTRTQGKRAIQGGGDIRDLPLTPGRRPEWWTPERARDAEVISVPQFSFVFSRQDSTLYYLCFPS